MQDRRYRLRRYLNENLRMAFGNLQGLLRGAGWLAATLFPLLQGSLRNAQCRGKLCLREPALEPHADNLRFGLDFHPLTSTGFDLPYAVQDFLPNIALGLEFGQGFTG